MQSLSRQSTTIVIIDQMHLLISSKSGYSSDLEKQDTQELVPTFANGNNNKINWKLLHNKFSNIWLLYLNAWLFYYRTLNFQFSAKISIRYYPEALIYSTTVAHTLNLQWGSGFLNMASIFSLWLFTHKSKFLPICYLLLCHHQLTWYYPRQHRLFEVQYDP